MLLAICLFYVIPARGDFVDNMLRNTIDSQRQAAIVDARHGRFERAIKHIDQALRSSNNDPDILCNKIDILFQSQQPDKALETFKQLPQDYKLPGYILQTIGKLYIQTGRDNLALPYLKKAIKSYPNNEELLKLTFNTSLRLENFDQAAAICTMLEKNRCSKIWLREARARIKHLEGVRLARKGLFDQAIQKLTDAAAANPTDPRINYDRIVVAAWSGDYKDAITRFKALPPTPPPPAYVLQEMCNVYAKTQDPAAAENCCRLALTQNPGNPELVNRLLELQIDRKNYDGVVKTVAEYPKLTGKQIPGIVKLLQDEGVRLGRAGKYEEGEKLLIEAQKLAPGNPTLTADRIVLLYWANRHEEALKLFEKYPTGCQLPAYVLPSIAASYRATQQTDKALAYYQKILDSDPKRSDIAAAIMALTASSGKLDQAEKLIEQYSRRFPQKKAEFQKTLADNMQRLAATEARNGHYDEALAHIRAALKLDASQPSRRIDYVAILSWSGKKQEAIEAYEHLPRNQQYPVYMLSSIARAYENTGKNEQALKLYQQIISQDNKNHDAQAGMMRLWLKNGQKERVSDYLEKNRRLMGKDDPILLSMLGDAYLESGNQSQAQKLYNQAIKADPVCTEAVLGIAKIKILEKKWTDAENLSNQVLKKQPENIMALYCKAEALEKQDDFLGAYRCYGIIRKQPGGSNARFAQCRILSTLGSAGKAIEIADQDGPPPATDFYHSLLGNYGAEKVKRQDPNRALPLLQNNLKIAMQEKDRSFLNRSRNDLILTNAQQDAMRQVIQEYEQLRQTQSEVPYWITEAVGDAYLYLHQPTTALKYYHQAEKQRIELGINRYPDNFMLQMAIYYALVEQRNYGDAGKKLDQMEHEVATTSFQRGNRIDNWDLVTVQVERAWWLLYQDRYKEAEHYLNRLLPSAPLNTSILTTQAYLHYYRGWPRRALREFQLANTLDNGIDEQVGLAYALNENGQEKEARKIAGNLEKQYPTDLNVQRLKHDLEIEELRTDTVNFSYSQEQGQTDGFTLSHRLEQPIEPNRKVYVENIWKHVMKGGLEADDVPNTTEVFRNGVGIDWEVFRDLTVRGGASIDYQGKFPAGEGGFDYRIDDHWTLSADYTNYSLDAPGWIYLDGGYAQEYKTSIKYRQSEDFNAEFNFGQMFMSSDNNIRSDWSARQDKLLATWGNWKPHMAFEESVISDTVIDTNYYASRCDIYLYTVPYLEHNWYNYRETSITERFYVAPGIQIEDQYDPKFAGYLKYEQEWKLNDRFSLKAGITGTRRNYDGEGSYGFAFDTGMVCHF